MVGNFKILWDGHKKVKVSFAVYDEATAIGSVSIGLAVNNYDYRLHNDPTGTLRSWVFDTGVLEMRIDEDSLLNAIVGIQDVRGKVRWFPFCRFLPVETGRPYVDNLVASQRKDGSGLVDIFYDFISHEEISGASVALTMVDGRNGLPISTSSAVGDLGDNVRSGATRHIVWNPKLDIPRSSDLVVATVRLVGEGSVVPRGQQTTGAFVIDTKYEEKNPYVVFRKDDEKSKFGVYDGQNIKDMSKHFHAEGESSSSSSSSTQMGSSSSTLMMTSSLSSSSVSSSSVSSLSSSSLSSSSQSSPSSSSPSSLSSSSSSTSSTSSLSSSSSILPKQWVIQDGEPDKSVALSGEGIHGIVAGTSGADIKCTRNYGTLWLSLPGLPFSSFEDCACSYDGTYLYVVGYTTSAPNYNFVRYQWNGSEYLRFAVNIGGAIPAKRATCVACSSNGQRLAVGFGGTSYSPDYIYVSSDYGTTWSLRPASGSRSWTRIDCSSDGLTLVACVYGGHIYTSPDHGATWVQRISSGSRNWASICSSSDGLKLAACVGGYWPDSGGYVYVSLDGGITWAENVAVGQAYWKAIDCSDNGQTILLAGEATDGDPIVLLTRNGGITWNTQYLVNLGWPVYRMSVSCSANGYKMAVACWNQHLWLWNQ